MKRKNKSVRNSARSQPLPTTANAGEVAFARGISRRVVVVDAAESPLFEQIIYIVTTMRPAAVLQRRISCSRRAKLSAVCRRCAHCGQSKDPTPAC